MMLGIMGNAMNSMMQGYQRGLAIQARKQKGNRLNDQGLAYERRKNWSSAASSYRQALRYWNHPTIVSNLRRVEEELSGAADRRRKAERRRRAEWAAKRKRLQSMIGNLANSLGQGGTLGSTPDTDMNFVEPGGTGFFGIGGGVAAKNSAEPEANGLDFMGPKDPYFTKGNKNSATVDLRDTASGQLAVEALLGILSPDVTLAQNVAQNAGQKRLAESSMARGVAMAKRKQWPLAIKYFTAAFQATPTDPRVLFNLGLANDRAGGRALVAAAWYRAFLIAAPGAGNVAKVNQRVTNLEIETESQIAQMLQTAQTIASQISGKGKVSVLDRIARAHAENGDIPAAQRLVRMIKQVGQKSGRQSGWSEALIAAAQAKSGQFDLAVTLAKSVRFRPAQAWALAEISVLYAGKGNFAQALEISHQIGGGKEQAWAYSRIGALQADAGDTEGAQATLARIKESQIGLRLIVLTHLAGNLSRSGQPWHLDKARTHLNEVVQEANKIKNFETKLDVYLQVIKARIGMADLAGAAALHKLVVTHPHKSIGSRLIAQGKKDFKAAELFRWSGLALQIANSAQLGNVAQLLAQAKLQDPEKGALSIAKIAEKSARMLRRFRQL